MNSKPSFRIKRVFDIIVSLLAILLLLPFFVLLALLIKCSSKGPVFFVSSRIGQKNKKFRCLKFRTMKVDAEKRLQELLKKPRYSKEWKTYYKLKKDPRVTPIGHFLRKTSLDELPQFFNVFWGDLSIVGPRPLSEVEIQKFKGPKINKMLSVKPGITGLSQISGRNHLSVLQRINLEQHYVESQGFLFDLSIILKTIPQIIFSKGAY